MTNERVGSFVSDLVEMAKAVEQVPQLREELSKAYILADTNLSRVNDLTIQLEANRKYASGLEQRLHDLEVANSAMELRFLEADDIALTLKRAIRTIVDEADGVLKATSPIVPETPVAEPTLPRDTFQGVKSYSVMDTIPIDYAESFDRPFVPTPSPADTPSTDASSSEGATAGESATPPTLPSATTEGFSETSSGSVTVKPVDAETTTDVSIGKGVSVPSDPTVNGEPTEPQHASSDGATNTESAPTPKPDYYDYTNRYPF